jgi:ribosomal protein L34
MLALNPKNTQRRCKGDCGRVLPLSSFKRIVSRHSLANGDPVTYVHYYGKCYKCLYGSTKRKSRKKGFSRIGTDNGRAILTDDWVRFIRSRTGRRIQATTLAQWAGVDVTAISSARSGKTWKHLDVNPSARIRVVNSCDISTIEDC